MYERVIGAIRARYFSVQYIPSSPIATEQTKHSIVLLKTKDSKLSLKINLMIAFQSSTDLLKGKMGTKDIMKASQRMIFLVFL